MMVNALLQQWNLLQDLWSVLLERYQVGQVQVMSFQARQALLKTSGVQLTYRFIVRHPIFRERISGMLITIYMHFSQVTFTVDVRAMDDTGREAIIYEFSNKLYHMCDRRSVFCNVERKVRDT